MNLSDTSFRSFLERTTLRFLLISIGSQLFSFRYAKRPFTLVVQLKSGLKHSEATVYQMCALSPISEACSVNANITVNHTRTT